jgi:hypothetical protein
VAPPVLAMVPSAGLEGAAVMAAGTEGVGGLNSRSGARPHPGHSQQRQARAPLSTA